MFENSNLTQYSNAIKTKEQIMLSDFEKKEKKHHLADDGKGDAFAQQVALSVKLHKVGELVLILVNGKAVCETAFADWQAQNSSVIDELQKIIERLPVKEGETVLEQGIQGNFDFPGLRDFIFREMLIEYNPETVSVQEDPLKAIFEYWEKLAKTGDAEAQNNLGLMYYGGHGTEKEEELALKYFQLAAQQGHADAQENFRLLKEAIDAENGNKIQVKK